MSGLIQISHTTYIPIAGDEKTTLDTILKLNGEGGRIRNGKIWNTSTYFGNFCLAMHDLWHGSSRKSSDLNEFNKLNDLLRARIRTLQFTQNEPNEAWYRDIKTLLHVNAKFQATGWSKSLKNDANYECFTSALQELKAHAVKSVKTWVDHQECLSEAEINERKEIARWIEADEAQLEFAGYMDAVPWRADEVPAGAILLTNPKALKLRNKILGFKQSWGQYIASGLMKGIKEIKAIVCGLMTGYPVTHAMFSMGNGRFFHVDKDESSRWGCSGVARIEDHSLASRQSKAKPGVKAKPKIWFDHEIMLPNRANIEKRLPKGKTYDKFMADCLEEFEKIANSKEKVKTTFGTLVKVPFGRPRPEKNYDPATVYDNNIMRGEGMSCSGTICGAMAKHGYDFAKQLNIKVEKASPTDFLISSDYDIGVVFDKSSVEHLRR